MLLGTYCHGANVLPSVFGRQRRSYPGESGNLQSRKVNIPGKAGSLAWAGEDFGSGQPTQTAKVCRANRFTLSLLDRGPRADDL